MELFKKVRKKRKFYFFCLGSFFLSFLLCFLLCLFLGPRIYLEEKNIVFLYKEKVELPKYEAYAMGYDVSDNVKVVGDVDSNKVGSYWVEYKLDSFLFPVKERLLVEIVDEDPPVFSLNGGLDIFLCQNSTYEELGYQAIDNYDGDITSNVEVSSFRDKIVYKVKDSSLNVSEVVRNIHYVDNELPVLSLKGGERVSLYVGNTYKEYGYEVSDNCDKDIDSKVKVSGSVNANKVGIYSILYEVTDNNGNYVSKVRTVEVLSKNDEIKREDTSVKGVIYLTFDDGPSSSVTSKILDILREENVKATFFVVHKDKSLNYLIKREYQEGHTVALHSYTHDYGKIYKSEEAYFNDLDSIRKEVLSITGVSSNIIRFPGGSSNTVSKRYKVGIMSNLTKRVLEKGYRYFDWNISSGDAGEVRSSNEVYRNVINGLSKSRSNVVLMHDFENNYYTLNALRDIIRYGKENGYVFERITESTPMVRHSVAN